MKFQFFLFILIIGISCTSEKKELATAAVSTEITLPKSKEVYQPSFKGILDTALLNGVILICDPQAETYYSNDFDWAKKGQLPASTFKIPNSMIALETGVVENLQTTFKWNGEKRHFKIWEQDMDFKNAFQLSCLPCYQGIAKRVGVDRMNGWLDKLAYTDKITVDSNNIDLFWITGDWQITPFQQIDFLKRLYNSKLPISGKTERIVKELMRIEENEAYTLNGKTGWSFDEETNNGWFVGYLETNEQVFFFATNVEPKEGFNMKKFPVVRKEVTRAALSSLGIAKFKR